MNIILDANAAASYVFRSHFHDKIENIILQANNILSPDLYIAEISNVLWQHYQFKNLPPDICEKLLDISMNIINEYLNSYNLFREAFSLATITSHPVYDCLYLISARRMNFPLLTVDKKLIKIAKKHHIKVIDIYNENLIK